MLLEGTDDTTTDLWMKVLVLQQRLLQVQIIPWGILHGVSCNPPQAVNEDYKVDKVPYF